MSLSTAQINLLRWLPKAASILSLGGSTLTLISIGRVHYTASPTTSSSSPITTRETKTRTNFYHRLLACISICDVLLSIFYLLGSLPVPRADDDETLESYAIRNARGNWTTCTFQGTLFQLGIGEFYYAACLSIYYVLVIRFNVKERFLVRWIEPAMHAVVAPIFVGIAILGAAVGVYNPMPVVNTCVLVAYPYSCEEHPPCTRGPDRASRYNLWMNIVPGLVLMLTVILCLAVVMWTVWQQHRRHVRFLSCNNAHVMERTGSSMIQSTPEQQEPQSQQITESSASFSSASRLGRIWRNDSQGQEQQHHEQQQQRQHHHPTTRAPNSEQIARHTTQTHRVLWQCFLYGVNYINSTIWLSIYGIIVIRGHGDRAFDELLWMTMISRATAPIYGFFNFLIFTHPRYQQLRKQQKQQQQQRQQAIPRLAAFPLPSSSSSSSSSSSMTTPRQRLGCLATLWQVVWHPTWLPRDSGTGQSSLDPT